MANQQKPNAADSGFTARLVAVDGTSYDLNGEQVLGRSAEADITIGNPKISRKHVRLKVTGQQLTVEDLGSANGTRVNQRRIDGIVELHNGDILSLDVVDLTVALTGVIEEDDATVVSYRDDATVVASWSNSAPAKPAEAPPQSQPEVQPVPAPAVQAPAPSVQAPSVQAPSVQAPSVQAPPVQAQPAEPPVPRSKRTSDDAPVVDLPGSWVDQSMGEHTQVLSGVEAAAKTSGGPKPERASDLPHLIIILKSGSEQVLELEPDPGEQADVWEIGRDKSCQIVIPEDSVSARHAQLIHQNGRWRMVNLLAANGIYVNGQKRLTAYLADGDEIKLGTAALIFRAGSAAYPGQSASGSSAAGAGRKHFLRILIALGAVAIAGGIWWSLR